MSAWKCNPQIQTPQINQTKPRKPRWANQRRRCDTLNPTVLIYLFQGLRRLREIEVHVRFQTKVFLCYQYHPSPTQKDLSGELTSAVKIDR
ncbi:hypothetical protein YC2023_014487 [Brassica napus]